MLKFALYNYCRSSDVVYLAEMLVRILGNSADQYEAVGRSAAFAFLGSFHVFTILIKSTIIVAAKIKASKPAEALAKVMATLGKLLLDLPSLVMTCCQTLVQNMHYRHLDACATRLHRCITLYPTHTIPQDYFIYHNNLYYMRS